MQLPIRDYVLEIVSCNNDGIEGRWSFFGKDSDDSRMQCLKSVLGMEKVDLIKCSSELHEFIDRVCIEIREIHTDLNDATHGFYLLFKLIVIGIMYLIFAISNRCELNDFWHCIYKWSWCKFSINKQGLKKCIQKGLRKCDYDIYIWI